jgi:hypothetical protein
MPLQNVGQALPPANTPIGAATGVPTGSGAFARGGAGAFACQHSNQSRDWGTHWVGSVCPANQKGSN